MIQVEEDWLRDEPDHLDSDADTEIMTTPEFYRSLTGGDIAYPGKHEAAIDSSSIHMSNRSICFQDLEGFQSIQSFSETSKHCKSLRIQVTTPLGLQGGRALRLTTRACLVYDDLTLLR